jgi:hypothetical protein
MMAREPQSSSHERLYACVRDGRLLIDGIPWGPWVRLIRKAVIYADISVDFTADIVPIMTRNCYAIGKPGKITGVSIATETGHTKMFLSDAWGVDRASVETLRAGIERTVTLCADAGIDWRFTAANTAMYLLRGADLGIPIQTRYRTTAVAAIHAGPIIHVTGGYRNGIHIDRRAAYCAAMASREFPGGAITPQFYPKREHLQRPGISVATVDMPRMTIPPLPVATKSGRTIYPYGRFRGVWTHDALRYAMEVGARVTLEHTLLWSRRSRALAAAAIAISELPRDLAKPLYTRIWGKLATLGGWRGSLDGPGEFFANGLWWHYTGPDETTRNPPYHRPDLAAYIVGHNHTEVMRAAHSLSSVCALHVDSIWTDDIKGAIRITASNPKAIGAWKREDSGHTRYYASGQYLTHTHDGGAVAGYSGWKGDAAPTADELDKWASTPQPRYDAPARLWDNDPRLTIDARSEPIEINDTGYRVTFGTDPWEDSLWRDDGTLRVDRREDKPSDNLDI